MEEDEMTSVALLKADSLLESQSQSQAKTQSQSQSLSESESEDEISSAKQDCRKVAVKHRRFESLDIILYLSTCAFIIILTIYYGSYKYKDKHDGNSDVDILYDTSFKSRMSLQEETKNLNTSIANRAEIKKLENMENATKITFGAEKMLPISVSVPASPIESAVAEVQKLYQNFQDNETEKKIRVMNVFILTTWRSGSSFFGEAMSSHPQIFYHFEPLMFYDFKELESGPELQKALTTLTNLSNCTYPNVNDSAYMSKMKIGWNLLTLNNKISSQCKKLGDDCFSPNFLNPTCQLFPIKLFKLVRLRGRAAETLLDKFENAKIIYLVRDPRGTWGSRMNVKWCSADTSCGHIDNFCNSLTTDLHEIQKLQKKQSKNPQKQNGQQMLIQVIKYEDVVWNPLINFKRIFSQLGLPWHDSLEKYLETHTHASSPDPMSTVKVSKLRANLWKKFLPWKTVQEIQNSCHDYITKLNYPIYTENDFSLIQNEHKDDVF